MIAEPPVAGAVKATEAVPSPAVAVGAVIVAGTVVAVMLLDAALAAPVADVFVPVTAKV
jgi:hypothetical protein